MGITSQQFCPILQILEIAQSTENQRIKLDACKELLPYLAPKLKSIQHQFNESSAISLALHLGTAQMPAPSEQFYSEEGE